MLHFFWCTLYFEIRRYYFEIKKYHFTIKKYYFQIKKYYFKIQKFDFKIDCGERIESIIRIRHINLCSASSLLPKSIQPEFLRFFMIEKFPSRGG